MRTLRDAATKVLNRDAMCAARQLMRQSGQKLVFTNGCFDILHAGHAQYLAFARQQGDALVVGINSDRSVQRNKGPHRPIVPEHERAGMLAALEAVDFVVIFDEDEPIKLITAILPDVLVKGKDWAHYVSGRDVVEAHGGKVVLAEFVAGLSTTNIIARIAGPHAAEPPPPGVPRARPPSTEPQ
ncbi:MAG: D-glycero-beta-D-manno-heptose 1-phosphate adenylyltransferase [Verrucomicrobia bacterium]|nr:D-glycero-beta-D-manno-heptose 1-phosphate adenylyltransferase [Verrucomicrobiota bacterium]